MCAINPKHQRHFTLSVYTSEEVDESDFLKMVYDKCVNIESQLNQDMRLRWHIKED